jgi:hypothetical protein
MLKNDKKQIGAKKHHRSASRVPISCGFRNRSEAHTQQTMSFAMDVKQLSIDSEHLCTGNDRPAALSRDPSPDCNRDSAEKGCGDCFRDQPSDSKESGKKLMPILDLETAKEASGDEILFLVKMLSIFPQPKDIFADESF